MKASIFRLDLLREAWDTFVAGVRKVWRDARAVMTGSALLAFGLMVQVALLLCAVLVWLAMIVLAPMDGHALAAYANNLPQYQLVADRTLYILENELAFSKLVNMRYGKEYENQPHGPTLQVKQPPRYTVRNGDAMQLQGITEPTVLLNVQPVFGVDIPIGSSEMALILGNSLSDWDKEIGGPAASQLATAFEQNIAALNNSFYNLVGTPGTTPATLAAIAPTQQRLDEEATPRSERGAVVGPATKWALVPGLSGNFVTPVIEQTEMRGNLQVPLLGLDNGIDFSQVAPTHTCGVAGGTPLINGANQQGTSFITDGWTAGSFLNPGDVITFAGVNAVNPQSRVSTGALRQFVVASLCTADAGGNMIIPVLNPLNPPIGGVAQQFQTTDSMPADNAAITVSTMSNGGGAFARSGLTNQENMVFHRDSMLVVSLPQPVFPNEWFMEMREYNGIGYRMWMSTDPRNNQGIMRLDILAAFGVGRREGCVRWTA